MMKIVSLNIVSFIPLNQSSAKWLYSSHRTFTMSIYFIYLSLYLYLYSNQKSFLRCWDFLCFLSCIDVLTLSLFLKLLFRKLEHYPFCEVCFLEVVLYFMNLPSDFAWNIIVISGLVLSSLLWRRSLLYKNQSSDLLSKSMDWFLYGRDLRHERVNCQLDMLGDLQM